MVALVRCAGGKEQSPATANYQGIRDCKASQSIAGGSKSCSYGCMGLGSCIDACQFDAIVTTSNGLVRVLPDKCTGCKACVAACPRNIIEMIPKAGDVHVLCINPDKAKAAKSACTVGCTGCKLCTKQTSRIVMNGALATVQYDTDEIVPEDAALSCPQSAIFDSRVYQLKNWLENKTTRDDFSKKASDWKAEQKKKKAEAKAKAKAKKETKAATETEQPAQKEGDA
jgi:electron transport complex protein RnfB